MKDKSPRFRRLASLPDWADTLDEPARRALRLSVGRVFRVTTLNEAGHIGLDVSSTWDSMLGTTSNEIWVEPEFLSPVALPRTPGLSEDALAASWHLVRGDALRFALGLSPKLRVSGSGDSLLLGPSSIDPTKQARVRRQFWGAMDRRLFGDSASAHADGTFRGAATACLRALKRARDDEATIVIWTDGSANDALHVVQLLATTALFAIAPARIRLARLHRLEGYRTPGLPTEYELLSAFLVSGTVTTKTLKRCRTIWKDFGRGRLASCLDDWLELSDQLDVGDFARTVASLVRRPGEPQGRLSRLDEALLGSVPSSEWRKVSRILLNRVGGLNLIFAFDGVGDLVLIDRLRAWAERPGVLETRPIARGELPGDLEYRLGPLGIRYLQRGIGPTDDIPPLMIGGYRTPLRPRRTRR